MELELKHLAPYLPYDLKVIHKDQFGSADEKLISLSEECCTFSFNQDWFFDCQENDCEIKPILKSLSKLTNEELIPIGLFIRDIEKHKATYKDNIFAVEDAKAWIRGGMKPVLSLNQIMCIMEHLYSIHADIFGLIDAGLAVELKD